MINIGIVGVGGFAALWRRVLAQLELEGRAKLVAVAERDQSGQAEALDALQAQGCHIYPSLTAMLVQESGRLQMIGLPVGIPWHADLAIEALNAGHNLLIEKPLAATIQQAVTISETADRTGRHCQVAFQFMYSPTIQQLATTIQSGTMGRVVSMRNVTGWPRPASYYARNAWAGALRCDDQWVLDGPATNAVAHHLMSMLYLGACSPGTTALASILSVQGELYHAKPIASYDTSSMRIQLSNDAVIVQNLSHAVTETINPVIDMRLERATVHWEAATDTATITYADGNQTVISNPAPERIHDLPLRHMVATLGGQPSLPGPITHCTTDLGTRHVLAVNLAFESSRAVHPIAPRHCHAVQVTNNDRLVVVNDMAGILQSAHDNACLISELDIPWAVATESVSAESYRAFPQHFRYQ